MSDNVLECEACRPDAPQLDEHEIARYSAKLPSDASNDPTESRGCTGTIVSRTLPKRSNSSTKVGALTEEIGHHPKIISGWGHVTVQWWSHKIRGLHELDFAKAKRCDRIAAG